MRYIYFCFLFLLLSAPIYADRLMDIMRHYDARTMSLSEIDSVLNGTDSDNTKKYRLEYENKQQLFRHSFFADYYLIDTRKNDTIRLGDQAVRDAHLSSDGRYVVYAKADNNLYIYKVDFKTEVAITTDGSEELYNGISDWLYEEEFGITCLFAFSPDNKQVAFVRLNETDVPHFEWQTYLNTTEDSDNQLYPKLHSLRYPKAGEHNATATVCVYDIHYKTIRTMQLPDNMNGYIPRIRWTALQAGSGKSKTDNEKISEIVLLHLNRDQNKMEVLKGNPKSTICHPFYKEDSKKFFINYELFDKWQWLSDNRVIVVSEKGGYTQAYLYSSQGIEQRLLTPEERDITDIYGYNEGTQTLYYQAALEDLGLPL